MSLNLRLGPRRDGRRLILQPQRRRARTELSPAFQPSVLQGLAKTHERAFDSEGHAGPQELAVSLSASTN